MNFFRTKKEGIAFALGCVMFFFFCSNLIAQNNRVDIQLKGGTLSANLEDASLGDILDRFQKEQGIWVKGADSLADEKVSIQFADLPLRDGLERIFSSLNYSLFFDGNDKLVGIIFLGKADNEAGGVGAVGATADLVESVISVEQLQGIEEAGRHALWLPEWSRRLCLCCLRCTIEDDEDDDAADDSDGMTRRSYAC